MLKQLVEGEVLGDDFDVEEELESTEQAGLIDMEQPEEEIEEDDDDLEDEDELEEENEDD
jgi:hypothetical protein